MAEALQTFNPGFKPEINPKRVRKDFETWLVGRLEAIRPQPLSVAEVARELGLTVQAVTQRFRTWPELPQLVSRQAGQLTLTAAGLAHPAALSARR